MRVLVVTVVHTPLDARVYHRQVKALLDAGHEVVYAAPYDGYGIDASEVGRRGLRSADVPRAVGSRRLRAWRVAREVVRDHRERVDLVLIHDPELVAATWGAHRHVPVVWDVHEDLAGQVDDKAWLPKPLRPLVRRMARVLEHVAESRLGILLAEPDYSSRFRSRHPVVPNLPWLPPETRPLDPDRVAYLGRVSVLRGGRELIRLGECLARSGIRLHVIGPADDDIATEIAAAHEDGSLVAHGFVPNDRALALVAGSLAGLSLLHDHPNYRHSTPTKVVEYQAAGVPVITTPLPRAEEVVRRHASGILVPFGDVAAAEQAVLALRADPARAARLGANGRRAAERELSWDHVRHEFLRALKEHAAHSEGAR